MPFRIYNISSTHNDNNDPLPKYVKISMYNSFYNAYSYCINNAKENEQNKKS